MKILLTAINAKYIHSNLAVYSLKAYSEKSGIKGIELLETTINNRLEDIIDEIYINKPDVVAFSCYIWNIEYVFKILSEIKKLLPSCAIWLGGPEVSYNPKELLLKHKDVDIIMCGEGEETFSRVCKLYEKKQNISGTSDIKGIAYRNEKGEIIVNPIGEPLDLSAIPFAYENIKNLENRIVYYESSRGCPFSCTYCLSSVEKKLRFRDMELVKSELLFFIGHKVPLVKFVDRTFNCDKNRALEIWRFILEHDNGITRFHFEIAADLMTDEEIELISKMRSGLIQLEIGVQSANDVTIKEINRVMKLSKVQSVVSRINKAGNIHQHLDLIAGLPYETYESFKDSFNAVYRMKPNQLQLGFLKVLTGSYMADNVDKYGIVYKDFPPYEVLYTSWISYDEILKLKMVEEVVEIYYNSGQFANTIKYLENYYHEPFEIYYELGKYYKDNFPRNIKHSRIDRYNILKSYFYDKVKDEQERELFCEIMTFDIYLRENMHTRPAFAVDTEMYKDEIRAIIKAKGLSRSEHIEPVSSSLILFLKESGELSGIKEEVIEGIENDYFLFNYSMRNPLSGNGEVTFIRRENTNA